MMYKSLGSWDYADYLRRIKMWNKFLEKPLTPGSKKKIAQTFALLGTEVEDVFGENKNG